MTELGSGGARVFFCVVVVMELAELVGCRRLVQGPKGASQQNPFSRAPGWDSPPQAAVVKLFVQMPPKRIRENTF